MHECCLSNSINSSCFKVFITEQHLSGWRGEKLKLAQLTVAPCVARVPIFPALTGNGHTQCHPLYPLSALNICVRIQIHIFLQKSCCFVFFLFPIPTMAQCCWKGHYTPLTKQEVEMPTPGLINSSFSSVLCGYRCISENKTKVFAGFTKVSESYSHAFVDECHSLIKGQARAQHSWFAFTDGLKTTTQNEY